MTFIRATLRLILLILIIDSATPLSAEGRSFIGPISISDQYTLSALHLSFTPRAAIPVSKDQLETDLQTTWTNSFVDETGYRVDEERVEVLLNANYGITEELSFGIAIPILWRGGGVLDSFIESWHDFFGFPNGGRENAPRDQLFLAGTTDGGGTFDIPNSGLSIGNTTFRFGYLLLEESESFSNLSLDLQTSLPTAEVGYGHQGVDVSLGLIGSKQFSDLELTAGAAYLYYGDDDLHGISYKSHHVEIFGWSEYFLADWVSLQVGLLWSNITIENVVGHPNHRLYLDTGLSFLVDDQNAITAIVRENPSATDGTADVSFILGWKKAWN